MIGTASATTYTYSGNFYTRTDGTNTNVITMSSGYFSSVRSSLDSVAWNNKWTNGDTVDHTVSTPYSCVALGNTVATHTCYAWNNYPTSGYYLNTQPVITAPKVTYNVNTWHSYDGLNSNYDTSMTFTLV